MRITLSESNSSAPPNQREGWPDAPEPAEIAGPPCIVAWVGDSSDPLTLQAKALCERNADAVATYRDVASIVASPPRLPLTHVLLAQTDRSHSVEASQIRDLRRVAPTAKILRWLGPLVAPSVGLPGQDDWIESISWRDSSHALPNWLDGRPDSDDSARSCTTQGLIIVSRSWATADALFDAVESIAAQQNKSMPVMTWRRDGLTRADRFTNAHVVWDDSVWRPSTPKPCRLPADAANREYRHIWLTGMATPSQIDTALRSGVNVVWNKPTRRESIEALWR
ncbi:hypothetical protein [Rhodopirellula bahusiensis]|uniref:Uncharacterized protein n=1 Tax=Rhodopirellula bahusiensis TaxID=2014065 RepID=A0A2G1W9D5_9BACT|nr:hypothetical protein [Rhodopirellula bahusiensis]PHQ35652.1 hypothetical protein CEE69_08520 [Rhodopirellula bahusiensis]